MPLSDEEEARFAAIARDNGLEAVLEKPKKNRMRLILFCVGFIVSGLVLMIVAVVLQATAGGVAGFAIACYGAYHLSKQFIANP